MKALMMIQKLFSNATANRKKRVHWCSIITGYMNRTVMVNIMVKSAPVIGKTTTTRWK